MFVRPHHHDRKDWRFCPRRPKDMGTVSCLRQWRAPWRSLLYPTPAPSDTRAVASLVGLTPADHPMCLSCRSSSQRNSLKKCLSTLLSSLRIRSGVVHCMLSTLSTPYLPSAARVADAAQMEGVWEYLRLSFEEESATHRIKAGQPHQKSPFPTLLANPCLANLFLLTWSALHL
jgi:hypothetical protein